MRFSRCLPLSTTWMALIIGTILCALVFPETVFALEGNSPAKTVPEEKSGMPSIMNMIADSGPTGWGFMLVLGAFSVYATMVVVERFTSIRQPLLLPLDFVETLQTSVVGKEADIKELRDLCAKYDAPPANILSAGLLRAGRSLSEVEKALEDAAAREMAELRSRVRPLNVIGSIAPLVGLLGTVVGMISAFYTASSGGLGGKGESLAQGIYLALITTAAGLAIAIPCLLLGAFFNAKLDRIFREIDLHLAEVLPSFGALEKSQAGEFSSEEKEQLLTPAK